MIILCTLVFSQLFFFLFLQTEIDANAKNFDGNTALDVAMSCSATDERIVESLLKRQGEFCEETVKSRDGVNKMMGRMTLGEGSIEKTKNRLQ